MDTDLSRFLEAAAAIPAGASRDERWRELVAGLSAEPVPTGRLARLWAMGSLEARLAITYLLGWLQERFATEEERASLRDRTHLRAAARLFSGMGYLRGAALKIGQTIAQFPTVLPRQYIDLLSSLHAEVPPMHFSLLREQVRSELGREPEEIFAEFETEAFAAASLGQVHGARLASGERVVVKIQYPNIARTIDEDVANARTLLHGMPFLHEWRNTLDVVEEIGGTLRRECDYRRELENAERARRALAGLDEIVVPRTYPELSTGKILVLERLGGEHPAPFVARAPSQEERDRFGTAILRANFRLWCSERMIHADPNPANYLRLPDGRVGLLDFGCVRDFDEGEWEIMRTSTAAIRTGDEGDLRAAVRAMADLQESELDDPERWRVTREFCDWMWEPLRVEGDFDFTDGEHLRRGFEVLGALLRRRYTRMMPVGIWLDRQICGLRGLFTLLECRVPYRRIHEEETARAGI